MKKINILIIVVLILCGCQNKNQMDNNLSSEESGCNANSGVSVAPSISPEIVNNIINNYDKQHEAVIIDVRTAEEYNEGHIAKAINLPLGQITAQYMAKSGIEKDMQLIVYCRSGSRSKQALSILKKLGYTNIYDLGGINDWPFELVS